MDKLMLHRERSSQLFPVFLGLNLEQRDVYAVLELSNSFVAEEQEEIIGNSCVVLCMMEIPDLMIPTDILSFFAQALTEIQCFRIFRHYLHAEKYVGLLFFPNISTANIFLQHYNQQMLSTLFEGVCDLRPVTSISIQTKHHHIPLSNYQILQRDINQMDLDSFSNSSESELALFLHHNANYKIGSTITGTNQLSRETSNDAEITDVLTSPTKENCTLCLESLVSRHPHSIVLYCGHSFHLQCLVRAEGMFCPVCRFQHAHSLQQAPTCVYCRSSEHNLPAHPRPTTSTTTHFSSSTSASGLLTDETEKECDVTTDDTATRTAPWKSPTPSSSTSQNQALEIARDIWLCLVCGVTSCGELQGNHRRRHFEETRHAYAMQVFTRRVYDFAGGGYVHRLVLQQTAEDTPNVTTQTEEGEGIEGERDHAEEEEEFVIRQQPFKVVEHHQPMFQLQSNLSSTVDSTASSYDPHPPVYNSHNLHSIDGTGLNEMWMRPLHPPPMTLAHEEQHMAYKLEDLLQQYNEVLAWRMQQTREHYEAQLRRIWQHQSHHSIDTHEKQEKEEKLEQETAIKNFEEGLRAYPASAAILSTASNDKGRRNSSVKSSEGLFWLRKLQTSLLQEKQKWIAQNETLRHKLRMSQRDQEDAMSMIEQLQANEPVWQQQVKRSETQWRRAEQEQQLEKEKWTKKVATLMQKLEENTKFASSVRPSARVCETAPGDDDNDCYVDTSET